MARKGTSLMGVKARKVKKWKLPKYFKGKRTKGVSF